MISEKLLIIVEGIIRNAAEAKRMNAGYSGAHHDGGARELEGQLETFLCGINEKFPDSWEEYVEAARKELNIEAVSKHPDYKRYLELKDKYGYLD